MQGTGKLTATYNFRTSFKGGGSQPGTKQESREKEKEEEEPFLLCRQCGNPITSKSARIVVNGAHQHTFANPHGLVFEIGCFKNADGCAPVGAPTDEFTWFAGYMWRVALCRSCLAHMGWLYTGQEASGFFGLILDHLIDPGK